jgi:hypothetical protein
VKASTLEEAKHEEPETQDQAAEDSDDPEDKALMEEMLER